MTAPDATNDDLVEFLAKKRKTEAYRGAQDEEIVAREKNKFSYFLAALGFAACIAAYAAGLMRIGGVGFGMVGCSLIIGGVWLLRRYRRLDDFAALLRSRGQK